jgi:hypothetical protein
MGGEQDSGEKRKRQRERERLREAACSRKGEEASVIK